MQLTVSAVSMHDTFPCVAPLSEDTTLMMSFAVRVAVGATMNCFPHVTGKKNFLQTLSLTGSTNKKITLNYIPSTYNPDRSTSYIIDFDFTSVAGEFNVIFLFVLPVSKCRKILKLTPVLCS